MTEIEKLYENAGFKKDLPINLADLDFSEEDCDELCLDNSCDECRYKTYPPFTAEKQIELIKLLASYGKYNQTRRLLLECIDGEWYIAFYEDLDLMSNGSEVDFKECLAKVINKLWQSLTEQEQQQIKEILQ